MSTQIPARRRFLIQAAVITAALPFVGPRLIAQVDAQELPRLPLDNATAKALAYEEDYTKVKHPSFKPGSNCANCQFFTTNNSGCTLFPGFSVPAEAWCSAWAKKA